MTLQREILQVVLTPELLSAICRLIISARFAVQGKRNSLNMNRKEISSQRASDSRYLSGIF
jgi:hypothetical protein